MGALLLLIIFVAAILIHLPIGFAIILSNLFLCVNSGYAINISVSGMFSGVDSFTLLAIPFFMLAGNIMCEGGIANRIVEFCEALVGHHTGGFGLSLLLLCRHRRLCCCNHRCHWFSYDPDDGKQRIQQGIFQRIGCVCLYYGAHSSPQRAFYPIWSYGWCLSQYTFRRWNAPRMPNGNQHGNSQLYFM